jgi:FlaG/FlaF family flagellin (archaellin)
MKWKFYAVALTLSGLICAGTIAARTFPLASSPSNPAASGKVEVKKDKNGNTEVEIKTEHLAKPGMLTPPASGYVVWFQEAGSDAANQGQLRVDKDLKSEFKTATHMQNFELFITAENDPLIKVPSGETVLKTKVQDVQ